MNNGYYQIGLVLLSYASIQGFLLIIILPVFKKGNKRANITLAFLTFFVVILTAQFVAMLLNWHVENKYVAIPLSTLRYVIGPLLLLYIKQLLNLKVGKDEILHYLLFAVITIYVITKIPFGGLEQAAERITTVLSSSSIYLSGTTYFFMLLNKLHPLIYGIVCLGILNKYKKLNQAQASSLPEHVIWLIKLCLFFIISQLVSVFVVILFYFNNFYTLYLDIIVVFCYSIIIHFIGISAMLWPESIFPVYGVVDNSNSNKPDKDVVLKLQQRLLALVENDKPYLNPNLKLNDLAESLNISPHMLSHTINKVFGMNFYDFINKYRVDELKSRITNEEHQHFTLLGNALEVGFNSKASFNRNFKKHAGQTPSAYLKSIEK